MKHTPEFLRIRAQREHALRMKAVREKRLVALAYRCHRAYDRACEILIGYPLVFAVYCWALIGVATHRRRG